MYINCMDNKNRFHLLLSCIKIQKNYNKKKGSGVMKKKYEALAISFLFVNLIYSYGVVHLQPSIGDEIIGMLYNLFHLFEYNTINVPFELSALCFLIGMAGSFVMAICGVHSHSSISIFQGILSLIQGLLGATLMIVFIHDRHLIEKEIVGTLGTLTTITILVILSNTILSVLVEMDVRNHIHIFDHALLKPLMSNLSLSILFLVITLLAYAIMYLLPINSICHLFGLNLVLLTGVLGCFSIGMSALLRKINTIYMICGSLMVLICLFSFMRLHIIACLLTIISLIICIKNKPARM